MSRISIFQEKFEVVFVLGLQLLVEAAVRASCWLTVRVCVLRGLRTDLVRTEARIYR